MLSVLIEKMNDEEGVARTLSSLVGAAVEGVVREVIICDRGSSDHTARVADHAGCVWLEAADIADGIGRARGDWLLLLEPGARPGGDWTEAVLAHASHSTGPAHFSRAGRTPFLPRLFGSRRPLAGGLLISKRQAASLARKGGDAATVARSVRPRRLGALMNIARKR